MVQKKKRIINTFWLLLIGLTILYYIAFLHYVKNRSKELDKLNNLDYSNNQIKEESSIPSKFPLIKKEDNNNNNNNNNNLFKKERKVENNKYAKNILKDNFLYILLQPSPVDTKFRLSRLTNIDNGWAQWTDNLSQLYQVVQIYASTTDNEINKNKLHNINVITLDKNSSSASDYLVQAFSHLVLKEKPPRWLVFANDHTFIVPPNLVCFLKSLDSELPIYTGNRLQRGDYKGTHLYFASGGAGAVLSHVALKSIFFAWIITGDTKMTNIIKNTILRMPNQKCDLSNIKNSEEGLKILEINAKDGNLYCPATILFEWLSDKNINLGNNYNISSIPILRIYMSEKRSIILAKRHHNKVQIELYEKNYVLKGLDVKQIIKHCATDSEWAKINPGIVVANCLQVLFLTEFVHSEINKVSERFNCYSLVRTITGDVDSWYIEAKNELPPGRLEMSGGFEPKPLSIAEDIISLHYVSEMESKVLYYILSGQLSPQSSIALKSVWPQTGQQIGAYSRKVKDENEYEALYAYIMRKAKVYSVEACNIKVDGTK